MQSLVRIPFCLNKVINAVIFQQDNALILSAKALSNLKIDWPVLNPMENTYSVQYLPKHFKCSNKTQKCNQNLPCEAGHVFT